MFPLLPAWHQLPRGGKSKQIRVHGTLRAKSAKPVWPAPSQVTQAVLPAQRATQIGSVGFDWLFQKSASCTGHTRERRATWYTVLPSWEGVGTEDCTLYWERHKQS